MNKQTLLLPPDAFTRISRMSGGIDIDYVTPAIYSAQITEIRRVLTIPLYDKLIDDYENDALTGIYLNIWENYVVDMLSYFSVRDYIKTGSYSIGQAGIFKNTPDNTSAPDYQEITKLADTYGYLGHTIEHMFISYIKTVSIPEYPSDTTLNIKGSNGLNMYF